jgi:protein-disulfide isomerase
MDHNDSLWTGRQMDALTPPPEWQPDPGAALTRLRRRDREFRRRVWLVFAASAAAIAIAAVLLRTPLTPTITARMPGVPAAFHQTGRADAPIVCEIYTDYQCQYCASLFLETVPRLIAAYVEPGKMRLLHRDLPLPQHPYARLAARYANAAGRIGRYEAVAAQIFRTQNAWSVTGDLDARVAEVLHSEDIARIRAIVSHSRDIDASIDEDIRMARQDRIARTPSLVVVANGNRQVLDPVPPYPELKSYLDGLLSTHCREIAGTRTC